MGKGQAKGRKGRKGKPLAKGKGRAHTAEAWRQAQEVNERRLAAGKDARSTASISRSQLRAQQHHAAKAKAKQLAESRSNRSRSPPRRRPSCSPTSEADPVYSYVEESEEESVGRRGAGSGDPLVDPRQPPASVKAPGEFLPAKQAIEHRAAEAAQLQATGEFLPAAGGQDESMEPARPATGSGELLPTQDKVAEQSTTPGEASEPSHTRAPTELCKQEAVPVPGELLPRGSSFLRHTGPVWRAFPAKPVRTDTVMTTEKPTPLATAVAGSHTHTSVADAPQSGAPPDKDDDEYATESS